MANNRGIISGWDVENNRAKGVTSPAAMRTSLASIARAEGIMAEPGAATLTRSATRMGISWTAFTAVIASPLGGWLCPRIGHGGIDLTVGDATYPRIDVVYVRQWDYETAGDHPDSEVEVGVVSGTPSASPSAPATPTGALAVWTITVPKGSVLGTDIAASGIVTCRRTTPVGGVLAAASQAEADALVRGVAATEAVPVHVAVGGVVRQWSGSSWSDGADRLTTTPVPTAGGYTAAPSLTITSYGPIHAMGICIKWNGGGWSATDNKSWRVCSVPSGVPVPTVDYLTIGYLEVRGNVTPLCYRTATREIVAVPRASYSVPSGQWMYGQAVWIA